MRGEGNLRDNLVECPCWLDARPSGRLNSIPAESNDAQDSYIVTFLTDAMKILDSRMMLHAVRDVASSMLELTKEMGYRHHVSKHHLS